MIEYIVVTAGDAGVLSKRVQQQLADGWILQGGVSVAYDPLDEAAGEGVPFFAQAMVRLAKTLEERNAAIWRAHEE